MAILPKTYRRDCLLGALALVEKFMNRRQTCRVTFPAGRRRSAHSLLRVRREGTAEFNG